MLTIENRYAIVEKILAREGVAKTWGRTQGLVWKAYNPDIMTEREYEKSILDYLAWERNQVVYFAQRGKLIKIGTSKNLVQRLATLRHECRDRIILLGVVPGNKEREQELHRQFAHLRHEGEWFEASPELVEWILGNARLV